MAKAIYFFTKNDDAERAVQAELYAALTEALTDHSVTHHREDLPSIASQRQPP